MVAQVGCKKKWLQHTCCQVGRHRQAAAHHKKTQRVGMQVSGCLTKPKIGVTQQQQRQRQQQRQPLTRGNLRGEAI